MSMRRKKKIRFLFIIFCEKDNHTVEVANPSRFGFSKRITLGQIQYSPGLSPVSVDKNAFLC